MGGRKFNYAVKLKKIYIDEILSFPIAIFLVDYEYVIRIFLQCCLQCFANFNWNYALCTRSSCHFLHNTA